MIYGVIILLLAMGDLTLKQLVEREEPDRFPRPLEGTIMQDFPLAFWRNTGMWYGWFPWR